MMTYADLSKQLATMRVAHTQLVVQMNAHGTVLDAMQAEVDAAAARKPTIADVKALLDQVEAGA